MTNIWLGLFSGIAFGFLIQRIGATDAHRMARLHLMLDADIPRFMVLTVALSAVGIFGLQAVGVGRTLPRHHLGGRRRGAHGCGLRPAGRTGRQRPFSLSCTKR